VLAFLGSWLETFPDATHSFLFKTFFVGIRRVDFLMLADGLRLFACRCDL